MENPLISILIPQYNRKQFLPINLRSMITQKYPHFEALVINDGGEDVSDIVESFHDDRIKYLEKENGGLASARNFGLKHATGKYIAMIDQDDGAFPNFLETMVDFLENSEYKIAYCDSVRIHQKKDENGNYQNVWRDIPYSYDFKKDLFLVMNLTPVNCYLVARECFDNVPPFDETLLVYEDYVMFLELCTVYEKFHHIPVPLVWHTWREDGTSMSSTRDFTTPLLDIYPKYIQYADDQVWVAMHQNAIMQQRGLPPLYEFK